jgi:hypothetical protein
MDIDHEQSQHQAMSFSLRNILQGPWVRSDFAAVQLHYVRQTKIEEDNVI